MVVPMETEGARPSLRSTLVLLGNRALHCQSRECVLEYAHGYQPHHGSRGVTVADGALNALPSAGADIR